MVGLAKEWGMGGIMGGGLSCRSSSLCSIMESKLGLPHRLSIVDLRGSSRGGGHHEQLGQTSCNVEHRSCGWL